MVFPFWEPSRPKCWVQQTHKQEFRIVLTQGLNRQIRRMSEYLGYRVTRLKRVRIMNIHLDVKVGQWRHLTSKEVAGIQQMVKKSKKHH